MINFTREEYANIDRPKNHGPDTEGLARKLGKRQPQRSRYRGEEGINIDLKKYDERLCGLNWSVSGFGSAARLKIDSHIACHAHAVRPSGPP